MSGLVYEAIKTPDAVTHNPYEVSFSAQFDAAPAFFSAMQTLRWWRPVTYAPELSHSSHVVGGGRDLL